METKITEIIARGIMIKKNKILLCCLKKGGHYFLPGGHVEFGEKAEGTLIREFLEETNEKIQVGKFLGAFENKYGDNSVHHEVNLVFHIDLTADNITSIEDHIDYVYVTKDEFTEINFLPKFFKDVILNYWDNPQTFWTSDM